MDFGFEFDSGNFETELEEVEVRQVKKFDRGRKAKRGGSIHCTPVVHKGMVYFGAMDNYFYAVDGKTGEEKWRFKTNGMFLANFPTIHDEIIYVCSSDCHIYAISLEGKEIWRFKTGDIVFASKPLIYKDRVYFGSYDGYIYCLDMEGKEVWKHRTGGEIASAIAAHGNKIFTGSYDENFYCINAETGKEIWRFKTGAEILNEKPHLINNGKVYFSSFDNYLYAVDIETGKEVWRFRTGQFGNSFGAEIINGKLIHASRDGIMHALDPETGKEIWRFKSEMGIFSGCLIHGNRIYFGCEDGNMYVLDEDGKELWRFRTGGYVYHYPALWDNVLYFGSWDCHLYAVDLNTHEEIWRFTTSDSSPSYIPPSRSMFEVQIKKETRIEDAISEDKYKSKKKGETVSLSDYHVTSEYSTTSEYKQKSDYDTSFVIFEGIMEVEELWISDSKDLTPQILMSS